MKVRITTWVSFHWDLLTESPAGRTPSHYCLEPDNEAGSELRGVIAKSLALDPSWNPTLHEVSATIEGAIRRASNSPELTWLALRHGPRAIGAILLDPSAPEQFVVGPCVLMEYRNRGFGTLLLGHALCRLREKGVLRPCAVTREGAPVARFLYPKFGGVASPIAPLLAA